MELLNNYRIDCAIKIAKHRGEEELVCKRCGCINPVEGCTLEVTAKDRVKALCPDCHSYIKFMPQEVVTRLFDFNTKKLMVISEISSSILAWYLEHPGKLKKGQDKDIRAEINKRGK
jgi:formate dehydrogenase maturation protein FdhE